MATEYYNSSQGGGARPDLAFPLSPYLETMLGRPGWMPGWRALDAFGRLQVPGPGQVGWAGSRFRFLDDVDNQTGVRVVGSEPPTADEAFRVTVNVTPMEVGLAVPMDPNDPKIRRELQVSTADRIEEARVVQTTNHCLELLDAYCLGTGTGGLTNATSPFTGVNSGSDVDASGDQWSSADADIDADLREAIDAVANVIGDIPNKMLCSWQAYSYLAQNNGIREAGGGNVASSGRMTPDRVATALGSYGIDQLFVVPTGKPVTNFVLLWVGGSAGSDPAMTFDAIMLPWQEPVMVGQVGENLQPAGEQGLYLRTWLSPSKVTQYYETIIQAAKPAVHPDGGIRIASTY